MSSAALVPESLFSQLWVGQGNDSSNTSQCTQKYAFNVSVILDLLVAAVRNFKLKAQGERAHSPECHAGHGGRTMVLQMSIL